MADWIHNGKKGVVVMDIERELEILINKHKGKQVGLGEIRLDLFAEDCLKEIRRLKSEIARQSVTSEEVQRAIEWHKNCLQYYKDEDKEIRSHYGGNLPSWVVESIKASDVSITALQAYQPEPPKGG